MAHEVFRVFVLEDDEWYNRLLVHSISLNPDYQVRGFFSASELYKALHEKPGIITLDYRLPDANGEDVLEHILSESPETAVIVISEQENIETVVNLLKKGAYDYLVKEKNIRDRLLATINNAHKNAGLKIKISTLQKELQKKHDFSKSIIGSSEAMHAIMGLVEKAISSNITVNISGETGTGKEVIAKAIHYNSVRKNKPFVAVNVAAIPSELIESELFGHEKGAFTGAITRRLGKFEEAAGGTLFLDEVGEMELPFQAKLLRALQEKEITRVGSNTPVKTDCRIIVATHRNLKEEIKKGRFREDLYYRLYGLVIELPPLRERGRDVLVLASHFINTFCKENSMPLKSLSDEACRKLLAYHFPGNVRELKSTVELAVIMSNSDDINAENISFPAGDAITEVLTEEMTMREYELKILKAYLKKYDDNMKLVAEKLNLGLSTIYRMLKEEKES